MAAADDGQSDMSKRVVCDDPQPWAGGLLLLLLTSVA